MIGTFLHSPMLDELKSLETILMEKVRDTVQSPRVSTQYSRPWHCSWAMLIGLMIWLDGLDIPAGTYAVGALQVTGGTATPPKRSISVRLSDKIGELELVDLPMLPSLASNSSVSQCYERVSGSDAEDSREPADPQAERSLHKRREGGQSKCISGTLGVSPAGLIQ